jgi:hypothetical protein
MQTEQHDFAATYRELSDDDIADLYAESDTLTESARIALSTEIQRRGLSTEQLLKLKAVELRHEAQFDRLEKFRRKRMVLKELGLNDPKGWIIAMIGGGLLWLIEKLVSSHH